MVFKVWNSNNLHRFTCFSHWHSIRAIVHDIPFVVMFPVLCTPSLSERVSSHYPTANWKEKIISGIGMVPDGLVFYLLIFFLIIAIVLVIYKSGKSIKYILFPFDLCQDYVLYPFKIPTSSKLVFTLFICS